MAHTLWFMADTHFGHAACLKHDGHLLPSEITTVDERDEYIMYNWNLRVQEHDEVWHLGDFSFRNDRPIEWYTDRLNGRINLILGNHDQEAKKRPHLFKSVQDYHYLRYAKERMVLCHYPMMSWRNSHQGSWHLHGHVHGCLPDDGSRRMDVGVMVNSYYPISFEEVREWMNGRRDTNHHWMG